MKEAMREPCLGENEQNKRHREISTKPLHQDYPSLV